MKLNRSIIIPLILLIYLGVLAGLGYKSYAGGEMSAFQYFGTILATIVIIICLHFNLKRRERLRRERKEDIERNNRNN